MDSIKFLQLLCFYAGVISWRSDLSTDEDLSGQTPMDTASSDWTKEPGGEEGGGGGTKTADSSDPSSSSSNWADFSHAFPATTEQPQQGGAGEGATPPKHDTSKYRYNYIYNI